MDKNQAVCIYWKTVPGPSPQGLFIQTHMFRASDLWSSPVFQDSVYKLIEYVMFPNIWTVDDVWNRGRPARFSSVLIATVRQPLMGQALRSRASCWWKLGLLNWQRAPPPPQSLSLVLLYRVVACDTLLVGVTEKQLNCWMISVPFATTIEALPYCAHEHSHQHVWSPMPSVACLTMEESHFRPEMWALTNRRTVPEDRRALDHLQAGAMLAYTPCQHS